MTASVANYSRSERVTPYTGAAFDDFSRFMYGYKSLANRGFTFTDIDGILRNHIKKTMCILEIKTFNGTLTYSQKITFNELDTFLINGVCMNWKYYGFQTLVFEFTNWETGAAWLNGTLISKAEFLEFLTDHF